MDAGQGFTRDGAFSACICAPAIIGGCGMASLRLRLSHALIATRGWRAAWAWAVALVPAFRLRLGLTMGTAWVIVKFWVFIA